MDVGVEFGHYRVIEHIGRGGMADVWSARDQRLNRTVAIKTIARDLSQEMDPVKLFEREARTIAALEHPHILPIYEFGEYEGQLFIVMRYVSGGSLEDVLEKGPMKLDDAMRLARAIAQALDHAHGNKVIHLDLKPSNILLDSHHSPYLADFGLATFLGPEGRAANPGSGTLLYMAPEQLTADVLDHHTDIYSFAILIFHMLTGQLPFDASMPLALKQLQLKEMLPDIQTVRPGLPATINPVLRWATEPDVARRADSIREVMTALDTAVYAAMRAVVGGPAASATGTTFAGDTSTLPIDVLIETPLADLISRSAHPVTTRPLDDLVSAPIEDLISRPGGPPAEAPREISELRIDADELITLPEGGAEAAARREAVDLYTRARRAWAGGQGRFLLGVTHFTLINDYYLKAEQHGLELDEAGRQMLLRGALEYDYDIDYWWGQLDEESRRWVTLHALRSENAPARVRALRRLTNLPDADPPQIVKLVAQGMQTESSDEALIAAIALLEARARPLSSVIGADWRQYAHAPEVDLLLAELALDDDRPQVADGAARAIGRMRSAAAVRPIAAAQREGKRGALRALALVRDEAPSLPNEVSRQGRIYAWLTNTWRRLSDNAMPIVWRFLLALLGGWIAMGAYVWVNLPSEAIFTPDRWGKSISIGLTFGLFIGLLVLLASDVPARLRGFWPPWLCLVVSGGFGLALGTLMWGAFTWLFLNFTPEWGVMMFTGLGAAGALVLITLFSLPGWLAFLITAGAMFVPLYQAWAAYMPPVIYFRQPEDVYTQLIPMMIIIALGINAQALAADARALARRVRR